MKLAGINAGDIVECSVRGARFLAMVVGPAPDGLAIRPLDRRLNRFTCRSRQVIGHWAKRGQPRAVEGPLEPSVHQLELNTTAGGTGHESA